MIRAVIHILLLVCVFFSVNATWYFPSTRSTAWKIDRTFLKLGKPLMHKTKLTKDASKIDLLFLVDSSKSVGPKKFKLAINFIKQLLRHFSISQANTRVSVISYSNNSKTEFKFNKFVNRECVIKALGKIRFSGGKHSNTGKALKHARKLLSDTKAGARKSRTKKVLFLLTSRKFSYGVKSHIPAHELKALKRKAKVFVLGIGYKVNVWQLKRIASSWWHVYRARYYRDLKLIANRLHSYSFQSCNGCGKKVQYDECGRRCLCKHGKYINCCRVRKDFTSMTYKERERYIRAVKTVSKKMPYKEKYDKLITIHRTFFSTRIHTRDEFLPWHRWYILQLENLLREVDCRVTVPYWDWSLWSHDPWSKNSTSIWHASKRGFGGDGGPPLGCVNTGPFRQSVWNTTTGNCLVRFFNGEMPDAVQVKFCLNLEKFNDFELFLRVNLHDVVHCLISGTMCTIDSANAPEFFLHHGFVDKIWWDWQKKNISNKNAFFPNINVQLQATTYYPRDFLDIAKQPGCVKVCYDEPGIHNAKAVHKFLDGLSTKQLIKIPRMPFSKITEKPLKMFKVSEKERKKAKEMELETWGSIVKQRSKLRLTGVYKILGFEIRKPV